MSESLELGRLRPVETHSLLDLALHMADRADEVALTGFYTDPVIDRKPDGTPVTRTDREVESVIRDIIDKEDPTTGILGEEYGEKEGSAEGRWVIDPIDGTERFINGDPTFSVLIAYEVAGRPTVGVVSAPALGVRWFAAEGTGARFSEDGVISAARVSVQRSVAGATGMVGDFFLSWAIPHGASPVGVGNHLDGLGIQTRSAAMSWEAVRVATGEFDLALTAGYWWDVAPLPIIIEEAGGWAETGGDLDGIVTVAASNRLLADGLQRLLA